MPSDVIALGDLGVNLKRVNKDFQRATENGTVLICLLKRKKKQAEKNVLKKNVYKIGRSNLFAMLFSYKSA